MQPRRRSPFPVHLLLYSGLMACWTWAGCAPPSADNPSGQQPYRIVTTTGMVTDMVKNLVGRHADVVGLINEGVDPHLFRPTATDIGKLMQADLVVYNGLVLEGQMQQAFEQFARQGRVAIALGDAVPVNQRRSAEGFDAHPDPHIWGDAQLWANCVPALAEALAKNLPQHAAEIQSNAAAYRAQLLQLDSRQRQIIAGIPQENRYLVTAHDAFAYFSRAYGIPVRSVQGITTESDPGVADINELVQFLVDNKVPAIFVEATVNQANLRAVVEGARKQGWEVQIGGTLFSDSMGSPGTPEGTYIGMMEFNARTIAKGLATKTP